MKQPQRLALSALDQMLSLTSAEDDAIESASQAYILETEPRGAINSYFGMFYEYTEMQSGQHDQPDIDAEYELAN